MASSPIDGNLYSYGRNDPLRFADPSGEDSWGHDYVPEAVTRALQAAGKLSAEAAEEFMANTTGWPDDVLPHQWSKAHKVYNAAVLSEIEVWGKEQGITDLSKMSKAEAKAFVQHLRGGSNDPFIRGFIRFHEAVTEAAKKYNMGAKQINEVWGPMRTWLTGSGGFNKFLKSGSGLLSKGGKLLGSVGSFLGSAELEFALSLYNDVIKPEEMMKTHYLSPVPGLEGKYNTAGSYQWVPRDQPPPSDIDWTRVVHAESRFPEAYARARVY